MKIYRAVLFGFFASFAMQAHAAPGWAPSPTGGSVQCWNPNEVNTGLVMWAYVIKTTQSRRLGSDILSRIRIPEILSSLNVAQYEASDQKLSMLVDDVNENPQFYFEAKNPPGVGKLFNADVQHWENGGSTSQKLKCIIVL